MRKLIFPAILALAVFLLPAVAGAEAAQWNWDPPHNSVVFKIRHIFADIPGRFTDFGGEIRFDPANLAESSIRVEIKTASVDTGVEKRDQHLRTADFFDAAKYPVMTFTSREIKALGGGRFVARGTLAIKDVSRDFELPFTFLGQKQNPMDKNLTVAGFQSSFTLDRLAWHVGDGKFFKMGIVGKEVMVAINLELLR